MTPTSRARARRVLDRARETTERAHRERARATNGGGDAGRSKMRPRIDGARVVEDALEVTRAGRKRTRDGGVSSGGTSPSASCDEVDGRDRGRGLGGGATVGESGGDATSEARVGAGAAEAWRAGGGASAPRTRRETKELARRAVNEAESALLGTLCEDALSKVCEFLSAKDLASLECASSYFRRPSRRGDRGLGIAERAARTRALRAQVVDMPPFYRNVSWKQKLRIIEERETPLTADKLFIGTWVRVKPNVEFVKRMCTQNVFGYAVGWEPGMEDACGKCFRACVVSHDYRSTPVVGLSVASGLVAIMQGKTPTYGWYFPFEALTRV